jgi:hypothetical protein
VTGAAAGLAGSRAGAAFGVKGPLPPIYRGPGPTHPN